MRNEEINYIGELHNEFRKVVVYDDTLKPNVHLKIKPLIDVPDYTLESYLKYLRTQMERTIEIIRERKDAQERFKNV